MFILRAHVVEQKYFTRADRVPFDTESLVAREPSMRLTEGFWSLFWGFKEQCTNMKFTCGGCSYSGGDIYVRDVLTCVGDIHMLGRAFMCGRCSHLEETVTCGRCSQVEGSSHQSKILHSLIFLMLLNRRRVYFLH